MKKKVIISLIFLLILSSIAYADITTDCTNVAALYHFDGDANDSSGNGNDGTVNGATYNSSGKVNGAYDFDGDDDYIDVGNPTDGSLDFGTGDFSISVWIEFPINNGTSTWNGIVSKGITTMWPSNTWGIQQRLALSDDIEYVDYTIGNTPNAYLRASSISNGWHHFGITRFSGEYVMYLDGQQHVTDSKSAVNLSNSASFKIGQNENSRSINTSIDEVIIYNKALSLSEVQELYNLGAGVSVSCGAPCVPDCTGLSCGPDPVCGQSCGTCNATSSCVSGVCEAQVIIDCDADNDGFDNNNATCGGSDCDDSNNLIYPGQTEVCSGGVDDNCNNLVDCADTVECSSDVNCVIVEMLIMFLQQVLLLGLSVKILQHLVL